MNEINYVIVSMLVIVLSLQVKILTLLLDRKELLAHVNLATVFEHKVAYTLQMAHRVKVINLTIYSVSSD